MITDSIGNYLTKIRNAYMAKHKVVDVPCSNIKKDITKILKDQGGRWPHQTTLSGSQEPHFHHVHAATSGLRPERHRDGTRRL